MQKNSILSICLLLLMALAVFAQTPGGGMPSPEQATQNNLRMLQNMRSDPNIKSQALARMKERMTQRGLTDVDAKLVEIGKIMDEAMAMNNGDFEKGKQQLVTRIMAQVSGSANASSSGSPATGSDTSHSAGSIPWIDVHNHLVGEQRNFTESARAALTTMDQAGISRMIVMPPPQTANNQNSDSEHLLPAVRPYSSRFAVLGGGGSLNVMLQQAANQTSVSDSLKRQFEQKAEEILRQGAVGFGEMTAHHLSLHGSNHPYESVTADHPLLLLLADIAARHDVPIDLHFDVVAEDMPSPEWLTSPNNPKMFRANLEAFERLLDHNSRAKICWAHVGSDNTGQWTVELSRRMLQKHSNLYMSLRMGPGYSGQNYPLSQDGQVKAEWLSLFQDFPTRFVIGNDQFIVSPNSHSNGLGAQLANKSTAARQRTVIFLSNLPSELAQKIATENAVALYRLRN